MRKLPAILLSLALLIGMAALTACSAPEPAPEPTLDPFHAGILTLNPRDTAAPAPTFPPQTAEPTAAPEAPTQAPYNPNMRDWQSIMQFPSADDIAACNAAAAERSPYIGGWVNVERENHIQYSIRFKADYLPNGTYCCLGQFDLDYSSLLSTYQSWRTEYGGVAGYAGFQVQNTGRHNSIMSFWDVYCTAADGSVTTLTASVVYPSENQASFGGEGTGVNCLVDYPWQAGRWYEMRLILGTSETTGNTTVEQWVLDVAADEWTVLCKYDLGAPGVTFRGPNALFLENFYPEFGGEIRTMECRELWIQLTDGEWKQLTRMQLSHDNYPGSYAYGAEGDTFYMITTGVQHMADPPQEPTWYEVTPR